MKKIIEKNNTFVLTAKDDRRDFIEVEVGDIKQPDFYPQAKIKRWDNEVNFSMRLKHDEKTPQIKSENGKIKWQGDKIDSHFYEIAPNEQHQEGGYEFEVILKEKPATNIIEFTLQTKGLEFLYQPELTQTEKDHGASRPDNVVGSYAVYTSETKINIAGGKEYKAGKVGHIYRPRIEDANGDWVWGNLKIKNDILSVEIPQEFLDKAVYPVRHASGTTFGYTTLGSSTQGGDSNYLYGSVFAAVAGTIASISFGCAHTTTAGSLQFGIYDTAGANRALKANTGSVDQSTTLNFKTANLASGGSVAAADHWIVMNTDITETAHNQMAYDSGGDSDVKSGITFNNWPDPTTWDDLGTHKFSAYATYAVDPPTVTTQAVTDKAKTSGTGNGNITATGGANATRRGFCYKEGSSGDPTTADSVVYDDGDFGTGAYTKAITGLTAGTAYRVRAYAVNSGGTSYGATVDYKTTFEKIITEVVKTIQPAPRKLSGKTFSSAIAIVGSYSDVLTAYKSLEESLIIAGEIIRQTGKNLIESMGIGDIYERVSTLYKTLTEAVILTASDVYSVSRTLVEVLLVQTAYNAVLGATRTLTEVIKVVDDIRNYAGKVFTEIVKTTGSVLNQIGRILSDIIIVTEQSVEIIKVFYDVFLETVLVVPKILFSASRAFIEIIKIVGSTLNQTGRIFIEIVLTSALYDRVWTITRTFVEVVKAIENRAMDTGRLFVERVVATGQAIAKAEKNFIEAITVVAGLGSFNIGKLFNQTIVVNWAKETYRAFIYVESLAVRVIFMPLSIGKLFIQRVLGSASWIFEKTQFTDLIDHLTVYHQRTVLLGRVFMHRIRMASDVIIRYLGRLFEESFIVNPSKFQYELTLLYGRVLSEIISVVGSMGNFVIGKVLPEIVKVFDRVAKASAWLMSEVIIVADALTYLPTKLFIEIVKVGNLLTRSMGRIFSQTLKIGDIKVFNKIQYKTLTDSLKVAGSLLRDVGRVFTELVVVVGALGSWAAGKLLLDPIKVISSYVSAWTLSRVYEEAINVGNAIYNQAAKIFSETIIAIDEFVRGDLGKTFYETIEIVATIAKSLPKIFSETITAADQIFKESGKIFTETVIVVGEFVLGTVSKLFIEPIKIIASYVSAWTLARVYEETISVANAAYNQAGKIFSETIEVVGEFILGTISKLFIEIVKIYETTNYAMTRLFSETIKVAAASYNQAGKIFAETIEVVGAMASFAIGKLLLQTVVVVESWTRVISRTFTQTINVIDQSVKYLSGRIFTERPTIVNPNIAKLTGRTFTERIIAEWDKIKLVLNGTEVGLWKKVARVSTGVWKKISRNRSL